MSTSPTITTAFKQQFHDTFFHALQQMESRFQSAVTDRGMISGSSFTTNNLGLVEAREVTNRYQDKTAQDIDHQTRIAYMGDYDIGPLVVDGFDLAKLVADPTYKYSEMLVAAANRRRDRTIFDALLGGAMARTTEGGTIAPVTIPSAQRILASASGFTFAKLTQAVEIFRANECDALNGEELYIAYNGTMVRQILAETKFTSSDFMAIQMLQAGKVATNWMGFTWIPYNNLAVGAGGGTERRTVAWAKSSLQFGTGIDVKTDVDQNKTKRGHPTEVYGWMSFGAVRQDEGKVVTIDFTTA